jgi:hypothetical protein
MSDALLILSGRKFRIPAIVLRQTCTSFADHPFSEPYEVQSFVSFEDFSVFLSALKGK